MSVITKLRFPNSAVVKAPQRFVLKDGHWGKLNLGVRYGAFNHESAGTCLIDTGYSSRVTQGSRSLPLRLYNKILRPQLTEQALPKAMPNVDIIFLTHLHADHVSALKDYPEAQIIADKQSVEHFLDASWFGRTHHGVFKELLPDNLLERLNPLESFKALEAPYGLGASRDIFKDGSVLAVPLPGHMLGHTGFLFTEQNLLYAADAEWLSEAIFENRPPGPPARLILNNVQQARKTSARLRNFTKEGGKIILCHDPVTP